MTGSRAPDTQQLRWDTADLELLDLLPVFQREQRQRSVAWICKQRTASISIKGDVVVATVTVDLAVPHI